MPCEQSMYAPGTPLALAVPAAIPTLRHATAKTVTAPWRSLRDAIFMLAPIL
ncbi:hypothetical protein GCM10018772_58210 [Streptomyces fumanus]|uniref:Uncharacterized protein n=1 Tax=Streptomyces fumanus TaxID=67302 RepID=A0A919AUW5_9ACTN|nr:hypothetical protein GCM10018772_58210 [Streptomyces fumanus]